MGEHYEYGGDIKIVIGGMDELIEDIRSFTQKYPDDAGDFVRKNGYRFRGKYIRNIKAEVKHSSGSEKSLVNPKTIKVSGVKGYGTGQRVEIGSISPHFHLFERGHNLIVPWTGTTGFVEGRYVMRDTIEEYEKDYPQYAKEWIDKMLKKGKFI